MPFRVILHLCLFLSLSGAIFIPKASSLFISYLFFPLVTSTAFLNSMNRAFGERGEGVWVLYWDSTFKKERRYKHTFNMYGRRIPRFEDKAVTAQFHSPNVMESSIFSWRHIVWRLDLGLRKERAAGPSKYCGCSLCLSCARAATVAAVVIDGIYI